MARTSNHHGSRSVPRQHVIGPNEREDCCVKRSAPCTARAQRFCKIRNTRSKNEIKFRINWGKKNGRIRVCGRAAARGDSSTLECNKKKHSPAIGRCNTTQPCNVSMHLAPTAARACGRYFSWLVSRPAGGGRGLHVKERSALQVEERARAGLLPQPHNDFDLRRVSGHGYIRCCRLLSVQAEGGTCRRDVMHGTAEGAGGARPRREKTSKHTHPPRTAVRKKIGKAVGWFNGQSSSSGFSAKLAKDHL